uniref:Abasic site processing protein n=1 Tax=Pseudomonas syringae TaxID=317 RepID=I3W0H4_PSESX|nr:hypothetical protein [Pseudomonas syringae]
MLWPSVMFDQGSLDLWPGYIGPFLRRPDGRADDNDSPAPMEVLTGSFGLIPSWSKDSKFAKHTYNARSETVAEKPSFRHAWRHAQRCIIPAVAIYESDWRSGKVVATRLVREDGELLGIAGLWEQWRDPATDQVLHSYTMLTVNADDHDFMKAYHKPQDEKRMVVILPKGLVCGLVDGGSCAERSVHEPVPGRSVDRVHVMGFTWSRAEGGVVLAVSGSLLQVL